MKWTPVVHVEHVLFVFRESNQTTLFSVLFWKSIQTLFLCSRVNVEHLSFSCVPGCQKIKVEGFIDFHLLSVTEAPMVVAFQLPRAVGPHTCMADPGSQCSNSNNNNSSLDFNFNIQTTHFQRGFQQQLQHSNNNWNYSRCNYSSSNNSISMDRGGIYSRV